MSECSLDDVGIGWKPFISNYQMLNVAKKNETIVIVSPRMPILDPSVCLSPAHSIAALQQDCPTPRAESRA